jgi:hypothetical protein
VCVIERRAYLAEKQGYRQSENDINSVSAIIEEKCEDITRQDLLDISLKNLMLYYCVLTHE